MTATKVIPGGDRTHRTIDQALTEKRWCYYIPAVQDTDLHGGFVPSLVVENESGHSPMTGATGKEAPWVWGKTLEQAEATARAVNAKRGISERDALMIVASSMGASRKGY